MKQFAPIVLLLAALSAGAFALLGDDSIAAMKALDRNVELQRAQNQELKAQVHELRATVRGLQSDPRVLEKAARNELGLARPNESIFVFDKVSGQSGK